jgi:hypothetical protein
MGWAATLGAWLNPLAVDQRMSEKDIIMSRVSILKHRQSLYNSPVKIHSQSAIAGTWLKPRPGVFQRGTRRDPKKTAFILLFA